MRDQPDGGGDERERALPTVAQPRETPGGEGDRQREEQPERLDEGRDAGPVDELGVAVRPVNRVEAVRDVPSHADQTGQDDGRGEP
ncbi:MAG TPA: hypothetical protein VF288_02540 [Mycobacteriales bacterium]